MRGPLGAITFMIENLKPGNFTSGTRAALLDLGIPTDMKGCRCLIYAIPMHHADQSQLLMKEIYPKVGRLVNGTANGKQVEKQIRDAITAAWERRDRELWELYFPRGEKPKNGQFIFTLSEMLSIWEEASAVEIE